MGPKFQNDVNSNLGIPSFSTFPCVDANSDEELTSITEIEDFNIHVDCVVKYGCKFEADVSSLI